MKSKKASRILTLALAAAIALVPVTMVSAATTTTITNIEGTIGDTTVAFVVSYTMDGTANDQVTTLVTKGSAEITYDANNQPTNIVYIDQVGYSATTSVFNFVVDKPAENATYYVKVGGSGINSPASSSKLIEVSSTGAFTIRGVVTPTWGTGDETEDAKIKITATLKDSEGTVVQTKEPVKNTGAYQFDNVRAGTYTVEFDRIATVKKNPLSVNTANAVNNIVDLGSTQLYNADINGDGYIELADILLILQKFDTYPGDGIYDPKFDINGDGYVELTDALLGLPQIDKYDFVD